ncbi:MAG: DUF805 domain-containing protein [Pseudomonadota bacterium]
MGSLLFSPSGRIGPSAFFKGIMILSAISALSSLLALVDFGIATIFGFVVLLLVIPLIFMLIKRSHDAGRSGWMSVLWLILFIILYFVVGTIIPQFFGGELYTEMQAATESAAESGDFAAIMEIATEYGEPLAKKTAVPSAIGSLVYGAIFAFIVNLLNKQDGGDNQYGPVPAA